MSPRRPDELSADEVETSEVKVDDAHVAIRRVEHVRWVEIAVHDHERPVGSIGIDQPLSSAICVKLEHLTGIGHNQRGIVEDFVDRSAALPRVEPAVDPIPARSRPKVDVVLHRHVQLAERAPPPALTVDPGCVAAGATSLPWHPRHDGPDVAAHDRRAVQRARYSPAIGAQSSLEPKFPTDLGQRAPGTIATEYDSVATGLDKPVHVGPSTESASHLAIDAEGAQRGRGSARGSMRRWTVHNTRHTTNTRNDGLLRLPPGRDRRPRAALGGARWEEQGRQICA